MKKMFPLVKKLVGWPLSLIALYFLLRIIQNRQSIIKDSLIHINFQFLFYSLIFFVLYFFTRSMLWTRILQKKGVDIKLKDACFLWEWAEIKRFIPGNIWSVISKTVLFSHKKLDAPAMASSLLFEIQLVILGSSIVSIFSFPYLSAYLLPQNFISYISAYVFIFLVILAGLLCIFHKTIFTSVKNEFLQKLFAYAFPNFPKEVNTRLVLISIVSYVFFGLGTYFSITSFVFINPPWIISLSAFFCLSFLIGYLSFITPMGIGVREATITLGLTPLITLPTATFASLFTRFILIISEILFLVLSYVWKTSQNSFIILATHIIKTKKYELLVAVGIVIYFMYFTSASILRYENFYAGRFDLGNMDQAVWNTFRGRIFQITPDGEGISLVSRLANHADFILILIAPLYLFWADPRILLILQTIILSLGAWFIFLLAKEVLQNKLISLVLAILYLINPSVNYTNLYDFHSVTLATTFLLAAFYFLYKKRYIWFLFFSLLSAFTKEQVWIIIALLGLFMAGKEQIQIFTRKKFVVSAPTITGLFTFAVCSSIFYYLVWYAIPAARGSNHFALEYYKDFGDGPSNIVKNILFSPGKVLKTIQSPSRLYYLYAIFSPLGFVSLLSFPYLFFALPDLLINLLSNNTQLHQIYYQYTATITPFLFISGIFGLFILKKRFKISYNLISIFLIFSGIVNAYSFGPLPFAQNPSIDMLITEPVDKELITKVVSSIPKRYTVTATNNLGAHLSHRRFIYTVPSNIEKSDYVLFLLNDKSAQPSLSDQWDMVQNLKKNTKYKLVTQKNNFFVFKKAPLL